MTFYGAKPRPRATRTRSRTEAVDSPVEEARSSSEVSQEPRSGGRDGRGRVLKCVPRPREVGRRAFAPTLQMPEPSTPAWLRCLLPACDSLHLGACVPKGVTHTSLT